MKIVATHKNYNLKEFVEVGDFGIKRYYHEVCNGGVCRPVMMGLVTKNYDKNTPLGDLPKYTQEDYDQELYRFIKNSG